MSLVSAVVQAVYIHVPFYVYVSPLALPPAPDPSPPRPADPVQDVNEFIAEFEASYGPEHPVFLRGSYSQALSAAKQQLKPLVVYLHCSDHQVGPVRGQSGGGPNGGSSRVFSSF